MDTVLVLHDSWNGSGLQTKYIKLFDVSFIQKMERLLPEAYELTYEGMVNEWISTSETRNLMIEWNTTIVLS